MPYRILAFLTLIFLLSRFWFHFHCPETFNNLIIINHPLHIGSRREFFWDEYLIDPGTTTAQETAHKPVRRECVLDHDLPWEGDGSNYHSIVKDGDKYRMYYLGWSMIDSVGGRHPASPIVVCYADSSDGLHWEKPDLGLCKYQGSRKNNILFDISTRKIDNFAVFLDSNPDCPPNERIKSLTWDKNEKPRTLWCWTSADGIHFEKGWPVTNRGKFDSLNTAHWDRHAGCYWCYVRDFHQQDGTDFPPGVPHLATGIRDIRWAKSKDFKEWSEPAMLDFQGAVDFPLYTNAVQPYLRGDHMKIGFPSRYIERKLWTPNYDQLPGRDRRQELVNINPRYGLAVTDCLFMCSRDGMSWKRSDEAFLTPGPEHDLNWFYGDCYPAWGMLEVPSDRSGAAPELAMYVYENHWSGQPAKLFLHTIRADGFISRFAPYRGAELVTKPFLFEGSRLSINIATSAAGSVKVRLIGEQGSIESDEVFGDSINREVPFPDGNVADFSGRPARLAFAMRDAHLYSMQFQSDQ